MTTDGKRRCFGSKNPIYAAYHDDEWGIPVRDDRKLFEMLILEGAQAGLNWETVLMKRDGYRQVFKGFDIEAVAAMTDDELEVARGNPAIIRNKLKIYATRRNAIVYRDIQAEFGSFAVYLWAFVDNTPIVNTWSGDGDVPATTELSDAISKDLKRRGMTFVGSTIIYAYIQACGLVDDHIATCWKRTG
ncbi:MAG: DNA-3-methyladenine glycosylase I [Pseudomonadota bacterium]